MTPLPARNVELKAWDRDRVRALATCRRAVADADSGLSHEEAQVVALRRAFEIDEADLVAGSYCDMVSPGAN
jgi:hypothetical protein